MADHLAPGGHIGEDPYVIRENFQHLSPVHFLHFLACEIDRNRTKGSERIEDCVGMDLNLERQNAVRRDHFFKEEGGQSLDFIHLRNQLFRFKPADR